MTAEPVLESFRALGTTVVVGVTDAAALAAVVGVVRDEVDRCDRACSRFRADSELSRINAGERPADVSDWLCDAMATARRAAQLTDGLVDPTIGQALLDLGYDRSFEQLSAESPVVVTARHVPAWQHIRVDRRSGRLVVPANVRVDLGATAKALCADRAAARAATAGVGVLVSLGGDLAVAGTPPEGGWVVRVTDRADTDPNDTAAFGQTVAIRAGGLATSGTTARRWARAGAVVHHVVDPRTGGSAAEIWRTVSVAAATCVDANVASTAAIILGADAPGWLAGHGYDARLVTPAGAVAHTGSWPRPPVHEAVAS